MSRARRLPEFPACWQQGADAYRSGVTTVDQAKAANPYRGFGERTEHAKYVSWNRGWNATKKAMTET